MRILVAVALALGLGVGLARGDTSTTRVFSVSAPQARQVTAVVEFLRAYNGGRLRPALAVLAVQPGGSDCDYRREKPFEFRGRSATVRWLRARFRERDRLTLARIFNENPEGGRGVGVEFSLRTSNTLRAMGFRSGIRPRGTAKVVFTASGRIGTFAFGPVGGNPEICRPEPAG